MTYCSIQKLGFFCDTKIRESQFIKSAEVNTFVILIFLLALHIKPVSPILKLFLFGTKSSRKIFSCSKMLNIIFLNFGKCVVFQFRIYKQYYKNMLGIFLSASASLLILKNWAQFFFINGMVMMDRDVVAWQGQTFFTSPKLCCILLLIYQSSFYLNVVLTFSCK